MYNSLAPLFCPIGRVSRVKIVHKKLYRNGKEIKTLRKALPRALLRIIAQKQIGAETTAFLRRLF
jgi:hypothetical protein